MNQVKFEKTIATLKPLLSDSIDDALSNLHEHVDIDTLEMPWFGEQCFDIMSEAVINVIRGMMDTQVYLEESNNGKS